LFGLVLIFGCFADLISYYYAGPYNWLFPLVLTSISCFLSIPVSDSSHYLLLLVTGTSCLESKQNGTYKVKIIIIFFFSSEVFGYELEAYSGTWNLDKGL